MDRIRQDTTGGQDAFAGPYTALHVFVTCFDTGKWRGCGGGVGGHGIWLLVLLYNKRMYTSAFGGLGRYVMLVCKKCVVTLFWSL